MSDDEFEKTLNKQRYIELTLEDFSNFQKFCKNNDIVAVVINKGEIRETIKVDQIKTNTKFYPFFITKTPITRTGDIHFGMTKARPNIENDQLAVYMGKSKLYTLPFWKCKQHPNMTVKNDRIIQHIYLSELCKNNIIEKFVKEGLDRYTYIEKQVPRTVSDFGYNFKRELQKYKIYDIDWSTLINTTSIYFKDVLQCVPLVKQTYERKFLKDIDIKKEEVPVTTINQTLFFLWMIFSVLREKKMKL